MEKTNNPGGLPSLSLPKRLLVIFLRTFFSLLYHQFAWAYDGVASIVSLGAWQTWVQSVLPYLDGPRTLEIGYGPGHLLVGLCKKGITAYGLDESYQMGQITKRRFKSIGLHPNLIRGDAQTLPFADESINQVVMTFPAEYILKSANDRRNISHPHQGRHRAGVTVGMDYRSKAMGTASSLGQPYHWAGS